MHPSSITTLKQVALASSSSPTGGEVQAAELSVDDLREQGLLHRTPSGYELTPAGYDALRNEAGGYQELFGNATLELVGNVTSGLGKGKQFVTLPGYHEQFRERLDYEPFPGTFNVSLDAESVEMRERLPMMETVQIDGWTDGDRSFGPARCHPATVGTPNGSTSQPTHVIVPERTDHDQSQIELLAPAELRSALDVTDGDRVTVTVRDEGT